VGVIAVEFIGNRACRWGRSRNDLLSAQDLQHWHKRRVHLARCAQRTTEAVAARQVVAQELVDAAIVEHVHRQVTHRHPVREMGHAVQTPA